MNRWELEVYIHQTYGRTIGWIANVINCHMSKPTTKLRGLINLAAEERVTTGNTIDQVAIDGSIVPIGELEKYAKGGPVYA